MTTPAPSTPQPIRPPPFTIPPTAPHTHTLVLLRGRGGDGPRFGLGLLFSARSSARKDAR